MFLQLGGGDWGRGSASDKINFVASNPKLPSIFLFCFLCRLCETCRIVEGAKLTCGIKFSIIGKTQHKHWRLQVQVCCCCSSEDLSLQKMGSIRFDSLCNVKQVLLLQNCHPFSYKAAFHSILWSQTKVTTAGCTFALATLKKWLQPPVVQCMLSLHAVYDSV